MRKPQAIWDDGLLRVARKDASSMYEITLFGTPPSVVYNAAQLVDFAAALLVDASGDETFVVRRVGS